MILTFREQFHKEEKLLQRNVYWQHKIPSRADLLSNSCLSISIASHYSSVRVSLLPAEFQYAIHSCLAFNAATELYINFATSHCSLLILIFECGCPVTFRPRSSYFSRHWVGLRQFKIRKLLYGLRIINCYIFDLWWWTSSGNIFISEFFSIVYSTTLFSPETVQGRIIWR
jgi:hypothetical protein